MPILWGFGQKAQIFKSIFIYKYIKNKNFKKTLDTNFYLCYTTITIILNLILTLCGVVLVELKRVSKFNIV